MKASAAIQTESASPASTKPSLLRGVWWQHLTIVALLLVANFALYYRALPLRFFSVDDADYIQNNPHIQHLTAASLKFIFTQPYFANYAPTTLLSYALDVFLAGGKSALALHLSNILWHGWVVTMVYLLAFTIRADIITAAAASLLFLLHPAHVEVVAWISSRKDLMATGFATLSFACYILYGRRPRARFRWYAASLVCFAIASAAKQSVLLLPLVMLVWDGLVINRRNWQTFAEKIPFGLVVLLFGLMTWSAQPATNQARHLFSFSATELSDLWLLTGFGNYVLFRPAPDPSAWSLASRVAIIVLALFAWLVPLISGVRGAWRARRAKVSISPPSMAFGIRATLWYWSLIHLIPPMVLSFVVPITDRYLFLSSVGSSILLAEIIITMGRRIPRGRWLSVLLLLSFAAVAGAKTINYVAEWSDPRSVWYGAQFKTKTSQVSEYLGDAYQETGERINRFIKTRAKPDFTNDVRLAQAILGDSNRVEQLRIEWTTTTAAPTNSIAYRDRLWALAWDQYEQAVARRGLISAPNLFMNRGRLLVNEGKFERSILEFQTALRFAQESHFDLVRDGTATHAIYAIGVAHWNLRQYRIAHEWLLQAQEKQRKSGHVWIPTLDQEVERIKSLAARQP